MSIWLSQGFEGVPEQDNKIACQVIWFEDSSHLWTGVWANKPGVFQDLLFLKLSSPHLFLWDLLNNVAPRGARGEGPPASAQVPGHRHATIPDGAKHFSVVQRAAGGSTAARPTACWPLDLARRRCCRRVWEHMLLQRHAQWAFEAWLWRFLALEPWRKAEIQFSYRQMCN